MSAPRHPRFSKRLRLLRLCCVVLAAAWIASYSLRIDVEIRQDGTGRGGGLSSSDGNLGFYWVSHDGTIGGRYHISGWATRPNVYLPSPSEQPPTTSELLYNVLGFHGSLVRLPAQTVQVGNGATYSFNHGLISGVSLSYRLMLLCTLTPLLLTAFRNRRQKMRVHQGRCKVCGYDMSGSSERCPECGAEAEPVANATGRGGGQ